MKDNSRCPTRCEITSFPADNKKSFGNPKLFLLSMHHHDYYSNHTQHFLQKLLPNQDLHPS